MRVTILTPSAHQAYRNIKRSNKRQPTMGPSYLLAGLAEAGHQVAYVDGDALNLIQEQAAEKILETDPDLVGFSLTTPLFGETKDVARLLREAGWKGHIALGGYHPTALPEESLKLIPEADSVTVGEGDHTIVELVNALEKKEGLETISGLIYRTNHGGEEVITGNKQAGMVNNLDDAPLPAFEYYPMERYVSPMWSGEEDKVMGGLVTCRGCPFQCEFCADGAESLLKLRNHSVERVVREAKRLIENFGVDYLVFYDDTFTVYRKRIVEICALMASEGIDIPFMVTTRVDLVDYELLKILRDTGCFLVTYGFESGSDEILRGIQKNTTLEQARSAVRWAKDLGLKVIGNYMFGHWDDTLETCQKTLDFAVELDCDISQFAITIPYPGSMLHRRALAENRIHPTEDYNSFGYYGNMPWKHPNLSNDELIAFQKKAYEAVGDYTPSDEPEPSGSVVLSDTSGGGEKHSSAMI